MSTESKICDWRVIVVGIGFIGTVHESSESLARCAALSKFGEEGSRKEGQLRLAIYEDDDFSVAPA